MSLHFELRGVFRHETKGRMFWRREKGVECVETNKKTGEGGVEKGSVDGEKGEEGYKGKKGERLAWVAAIWAGGSP